MFQLFDYQKIDVHLSRATKSLILTIKVNPEQSIGLETLLELESILNWAYPKVEINSILLKGESEIFSKGVNQKTLRNLNSQKILKLREMLFKLHLLFLKAPQIIVFDLGEICHNLAFELSFGADVRLANLNGRFKLNNLSLGLPLLSTTVLPRNKFSQSFIEKALYQARGFTAEQLLQQGIVHQFYDSSSRASTTNEFLEQIAKQAPLPRIQSKALLTRGLCFQMENCFQDETTAIHAALSSEDWGQSVFTNAKKIQQKMKMTLIQGGKED